MPLTIEEVQRQLDDLRRAYLRSELKVRFQDGREVTYDNKTDILKAIQNGEDWIRQMSGQSDSHCTFAQHSRGY